MTTTVTKTIGSAGGRDYSTMQAWEDAAPANLVTSDQIWRGECYNDSTFTANVFIAGSTTDATRYKFLTAAAGQSFVDAGAALRYNASNGVTINFSGGYAAAIDVTEDNFHLTRIQSKGTNQTECSFYGKANYAYVDQCIFQGIAVGSWGNVVHLIGGTISNCLIVRVPGGVGTDPVLYLNSTQTRAAINCTLIFQGTFVSGSRGIRNEYSGTGATNRNLAVFGFDIPVQNEAADGSQNNYTNASTAVAGWTGGVSFSTSTFVNITASSEDYKLVAGSALRDAGTTDTTNAPRDIFGVARPRGPAFDVGCFEFFQNVYYVSSASGNNTTGASWTTAKTTLAGAGALITIGDTVYVAHDHTETDSSSSNIFMFTASSLGGPVNIICANRGAFPPTTKATTAQFNFTGVDPYVLLYGGGYVYGLKFSLGTGTLHSPTLDASADTLTERTMESCEFVITDTDTGQIQFNAYHTILKNCNFKFANSLGLIYGGRIKIIGGAFLSGSNTLNPIMVAYNTSIEVDGMDMSLLPTAAYVVRGSPYSGKTVLRNLRMPAGWTGSIFNDTVETIPTDGRIEAYGFGNSDVNNTIYCADSFGKTREETTVVRSGGGVNDGFSIIGWKISTFYRAVYPTRYHTSPEIHIWNEAIGSSRTLSIEVLHDGQGSGTGGRLTNVEIWVDVFHMGTSGYPLGVLASSMGSPLATPSEWTDSASTWTTTGLVAPMAQTLSVSFTPQEVGYVIARIRVARGYRTVYVDPQPVVT